MPRYPADAELPLSVRRGLGPIPTQLVEQIRALVAAGRLRPGDPLPSTRALAARLGVSRGTVSTAYDQLAGEGYLVADRGSTRISPDLPQPGAAPAPATPRRRRAPAPASASSPAATTETFSAASRGRSVPAATDAPRKTAAAPRPDEQATGNPGNPGADLRPGTPDVSGLTTTTWRAAWRRAAATPSTGHGPQGSPALRAQLAEHLRTGRSVAADPEDLLVTAGARDGLRLLLNTLGSVLARPLVVAVEDPGYPSLHRVPASLGHRVVPVGQDEQGLDPARLPRQRPDVVLVTPSHQYPLGTSMPAARRLELLAWAQAHDALLVEDDYDSELRYVGDPLPALAALDAPAAPAATGEPAGGRVATLGSFAKTLTPGLGLGFLLMPPRWREALLAHRADAGAPVSGIVQDAMTEFLAAGGLRRHTARMRREYRRRRDLLARVLDPAHLPEGVTVLPMDGGLHAVLELPDAAAEARLLTAARAQGLALEGLGGYWNHGGPRSGVVVGFGGMAEDRLERALRRLRGILDASLPGPGGRAIS